MLNTDPHVSLLVGDIDTGELAEASKYNGQFDWNGVNKYFLSHVKPKGHSPIRCLESLGESISMKDTLMKENPWCAHKECGKYINENNILSHAFHFSKSEACPKGSLSHAMFDYVAQLSVSISCVKFSVRDTHSKIKTRMSKISYVELAREYGDACALTSYCNDVIFKDKSYFVEEPELYRFFEKVHHIFIEERSHAAPNFSSRVLKLSIRINISDSMDDPKEQQMRDIHRVYSSCEACLIELDCFILSIISRFVGRTKEGRFVLLNFLASSNDKVSPRDFLISFINESGVKDDEIWKSIEKKYDTCVSKDQFKAVVRYLDSQKSEVNEKQRKRKYERSPASVPFEGPKGGKRGKKGPPPTLPPAAPPNLPPPPPTSPPTPYHTTYRNKDNQCWFESFAEAWWCACDTIPQLKKLTSDLHDEKDASNLNKIWSEIIINRFTNPNNKRHLDTSQSKFCRAVYRSSDVPHITKAGEYGNLASFLAPMIQSSGIWKKETQITSVESSTCKGKN